MTGWLLDTNVLSELRRPSPNGNVVGFVASKPLERLADASRRAALNDWLTHNVWPMFEERALPVTE